MKLIISSLIIAYTFTANANCIPEYNSKLSTLRVANFASSVSIPVISTTAANAAATAPLSSSSTTAGAAGVAVPLSSTTSTVTSDQATDFEYVRNLILESRVFFGRILTSVTEDIAKKLDNPNIKEEEVASLVNKANSEKLLCAPHSSGPYSYDEIFRYLTSRLKD